MYTMHYFHKFSVYANQVISVKSCNHRSLFIIIIIIYKD